MRPDLLWPRWNPYIPIRPTNKQAAFLLLPQLEALFGGAAGGGKSVALLAAALQYVDVPGYAALIVRKTLKNLEQPNGLIEVAKQWLGPSDARWHESRQTWEFPSGATLTFRHLQDELGLQGAEYHFIGVDEVTELEESLYRFLFSRLRSKTGFPVPLRMRATATPYGPGAEWVQRWFVDAGHDRTRAFIRSLPDDNPHLDLPSYLESLSHLDENTREQLRNGRWDLRPDGGLFRRMWFEGRSLDQSQLPGRLHLCRYWDLAATEAAVRKDPDYTVGALVGLDPDGLIYVLDIARVRETPLGVQHLIASRAAADCDRADHRGWERPAIRMEQEPGASGTSLIDVYRRDILAGYDFAGVRVNASKESRARPLSVRAEQGQLLLTTGAWNTAFLDEICAFPRGRHDDQVDAVSGAYEALTKGTNQHARIHQAIFSR